MALTTQYAYRTQRGVGLNNGTPTFSPLANFIKPEGNIRCCTYSPCGTFFAWATNDQVMIVEANTGDPVASLPVSNVFDLGFSPLGTYAITWERPSKDETGNATKNLKVWKTVDDSSASSFLIINADGTETRNVVGKYVQKSQTGWNLQYTQDERYCARSVTNEIQFYQTNDLGTVWQKLRVEGVTDFALSPGEKNSVAVFIPERRGQPATVKVYNVPQFESAVSQKTFFKGDKVQLKWNNAGTSLIVLAQTDVDKSNKSYYGETNLYVLSANGEFDSRIQLDKEGPIHDVAWSPSSKSFGVVYGYMPAKTTIFDSKANPVHSFALGPRNTIFFSPHGRFLALAGFGNLAGQMDIYDLNKDYAKISMIEATNASVCEWSPDGRYLMTATTSPRLRVDNVVKIWHINGQLVYNEDMHELYNVCWRPQSSSKHPLKDPFIPKPVQHASAISYLGNIKTPTKPTGAYRPPGARGIATPLHFKREDEGGAVFSSAGSPFGSARPIHFGRTKREIPGAEAVNGETAPSAARSIPGEIPPEPLSKTAQKNKKKREAKKALLQQQQTGEVKDGDGLEAEGLQSSILDAPEPVVEDEKPRIIKPPPGFENHVDSTNDVQSPKSSTKPVKGKKAAKSGAKATPEPAPPVEEREPSPPPAPFDPVHEKKVRALLKKMRAIDDLKMRHAGGESLEETQLKKIGTENDVRKDLQQLGVTDY